MIKMKSQLRHVLGICLLSFAFAARAQVDDQETETPYYYAARFDDSLIRTEFSPTARCGYFRFTFPSGQPAALLANRREGELTANDDGSISGFEKFNGESRM